MGVDFEWFANRGNSQGMAKFAIDGKELAMALPDVLLAKSIFSLVKTAYAGGQVAGYEEGRAEFLLTMKGERDSDLTKGTSL